MEVSSTYTLISYSLTADVFRHRDAVMPVTFARSPCYETRDHKFDAVQKYAVMSLIGVFVI